MLKYKINIDKQNILNNSITIPIGQLFNPNSEQYELIGENYNIDNLNVINRIIDYEKVRVHPMIIDTIDEILSLDFNLHFYINNSWTIESTLLSDIGYTIDDVENKRQRLSNSFIRLSFYDSNDLNTQNLLYYSTIFIDSGNLYGEYISNNSSISGCKMNFSVDNPKISTKIKSFEGYYIYLFENDLLKNSITTIYMKVEYNSALNGKTALFLKDFSHDSINGFNLLDLKSEMFIPISVKFDENLNKYIYWFNEYNNQNTIIELYQAKVK